MAHWKEIWKKNEDQLCSANESEEEQDSVVDNDGPPSLKQRRLAIESSDSLPTDFFMQIRQNTQPDPIVLDSNDITTALSKYWCRTSARG